MSSTLTESVVLARTKSHDLNSVKKLNCWGCQLKDVSIVSRMPNVEVISLSLNSIDSLRYFSSSTMLQELYMRKNEIKDLNEILHLSQLQFLKKLSLEDNPCANVEHYRLTVLKALPNLETLDNVKVTAEELYQAEKCGRELYWPGTELDEPEEEDGLEEEIEEINDSSAGDYSNYQHQHRNSVSSNSAAAINPSSHPHQNIHHNPPNESNPVNVSNGSVSDVSLYNNVSLSSAETILNPLAANSHHSHNHQNGVRVHSHHHYHNNNNNNNNNKMDHGNANSTPNSANTKTQSNKTNMAKANSLSDYNIYSTNGNFRCSSPALSGGNNNYEPMLNEYYENGSTMNLTSNNSSSGQSSGQTYYLPNNNGPGGGNYRSSSSSTRGGGGGGGGANASQPQQQRILPKGGKNRNANILSAVLCLIKELDYGSLEVVDTTIHCRMEEMED